MKNSFLRKCSGIFIARNMTYKNSIRAISLWIALLCSLTVLNSCSSDDIISQEGFFEVNFDTDFTITAVTKSTAETRATLPSKNDFVMEVYTASGGNLVQRWERFAEMADVNRVKTGDHLLKASYGEQHTGAFEQPYYEGSSLFTVKEKQTTQVAVTAKIMNTKVSVNFKDGFKNYFKDYNIKIASTGDSLLFTKNETRAAYFEPGRIGMSLTLTKQDGSVLMYSPASISTEAGKHYALNFDVTHDGSGGTNLVILFDKSTENQPITITLPGNTAVVNNPPFITPTGFANGRILSFIVGDTELGNVSALVTARGLIKSCKISTDSRDVIKLGWPLSGSIDLAATDVTATADQNKIKALGFDFTPAMAGNQMAELDFTHLIPKLPTNSQVDLTHTFYIEVTDANGDKNERFSVVLQSMSPGFRLFKPVNVSTGSTQAGIRFELSEGSKDQVTVEYLSYGTWTSCDFVKAIEKTTIADIYTCTIKIPALTTSGLSIRLNYNNGARYSNEQVIETN